MSSAMLDVSPILDGRNGIGEALDEAPDAATPTEEEIVDIQPPQPSKWQAPLSLAQGLVSICVGAFALLGYGLAFHARFVTIENNVLRQAEDLKAIRLEISDRAKADMQYRENVMGLLNETRNLASGMKTDSEWFKAWIRSGGEKKAP